MKKLVALFISVLMLLTASAGFALEFTGTVAMPSLPSLRGADGDTAFGTSTQTVSSSQMVAENDKYIFVVTGIVAHNFRDCSAVLIYDKATNTLVKTITQKTSNATWYCPVRNIFVDGDTLYIAWGNAVNSVTAIAQRANGDTQAPLYAYNVSNVTADEPLTSVKVDSGNVFYAEHLPYTWGGLAYFDKENGNLYTSKVTSSKKEVMPTTRTYVVSETQAIEGKLKDSSQTIAQKTFYTTGLSLNATQFIYKDGWLFEVLQDNAGLKEITATDTLVTTETGENGEEIKTVHNNMIYVYDLRNVELSSTSQNVTSCLKGVYETPQTGDAVIRDIEVIGNTIYASTSDGIEVIPFDDAKAEGLTEAAQLTRSETILTGKGGAADIDAVGNYLYAAFTGAEWFGSPNGISSPGAGELVIYDMGKAADGSVVVARESITFGAYNLAVNTNEGVVYVMNDTQGPPSMTARTIETIAPEFNNGFVLGEEITENVPHLLTVSNTSGSGTVIEGASWSASKGQLIAESDKYIFVAMAKPDFNASGVVEIRDKEDGSVVATLAAGTGNVLRWRSVRELYVHDEILYVSWGTAWNSGYTAAYGDADGSPTMAYDISNLTEGVTPTGLKINWAGKKAATHAPFIRGNASYIDKENDKLYVASVENGEQNSYITYFIYDTNAIKEAVLSGSTTAPTPTKFSTGKLSKNTVKFIVKDGWLYELLKSKAGLYEYDCDETLVDDEGNAYNNMVRVYDISGKTPTSSVVSYEDCLRGIYETETEGQDILRDIEVYGDTLYVSNAKGVDVVPLGAARESGVTAATAKTLTKQATLTGAGGANDLDLVGGSYLAAAFEGAERFGQPNKNTSNGEVIIYNVGEAQNGSVVIGSQSVRYGAYDVALNEDEGVMYVLNDTEGNPSMKEYSFMMPSITFTEGGTVSYAPQPGVYDITVKLTNNDAVSGTIICAFYEENRLAGVAPLKKGTFTGEVTVAEDFEITEGITKVKVMYLSDIDGLIKPLCNYVYTK